MSPAGAATSPEPTGTFQAELPLPPLFDQSIGYWTGEPDLTLAQRLLHQVPAPTGVERRLEAGVLSLRGEETLVLRHVAELRAAGWPG